jgi:hypothetical protein
MERRCEHRDTCPEVEDKRIEYIILGYCISEAEHESDACSPLDEDVIDQGIRWFAMRNISEIARRSRTRAPDASAKWCTKWHGRRSI